MRRTFVIIGALLALGGCASEQAAKGGIDQQVETVLRDVSELLGGSQRFSFHAEIIYEELEYEEIDDADAEVLVTVSEHSGRVDITLSRPSGLRISYRDDTQLREFFINDTTVTMVAPEEGFYAILATPGTIDTSLDILWEKAGVAPPLSDLLYRDPLSRFAPKILQSTYAGLDDVDGTSCHHILLTQETMDWQLWVEAGERPLPRKIQITYTEQLLAPVFTAEFGGWDFEPSVSADTFSFEPPEGALKIDSQTTPASAITLFGQDR